MYLSIADRIIEKKIEKGEYLSALSSRFFKYASWKNKVRAEFGYFAQIFEEKKEDENFIELVRCSVHSAKYLNLDFPELENLEAKLSD